MIDNGFIISNVASWLLKAAASLPLQNNVSICMPTILPRKGLFLPIKILPKFAEIAYLTGKNYQLK